jgi:hypothetical protein
MNYMLPLVMRITKSAKNSKVLVKPMALKILMQLLALQPLFHQLCAVELVAVVVQQDHPLAISLEHQEADDGWH